MIEGDELRHGGRHGGTKRSRDRSLTDEEHALWHGVTRSVRPLKRRRPAGEPTPAAAAQRAPSPRTPAHRQVPSSPPPPKPARALPLGSIDRRTRQRIARGTQPIDARIDLHGRTQREAHKRLLGFLRRAQADGARIVLVITGKGGSGDDVARERGVLRRQVPLWLGLPEFRAYVLAVEPAHVGHGGEGALYVRLRRAR